MDKKLAAFRGAVCVENTAESITEYTCKMCRMLFEQNKIEADNIVSLQFTITKDITKLNPATALRRGNCGLDVSAVPLFCSQEAEIEGGMPLVIRALLTAYVDSGTERHNIYLNGAKACRHEKKGKDL